MGASRSKLDAMRQMHGQLKAQTQAAPKRTMSDFRSHNAFKEVQVALDAAEVLGIESPYFRTIDAIDGTRVQISDRWVENFGAYDYLSLNADPRLAAAVSENVARFGVSARASRVVGGDLGLHTAFERDLAAFLGTEDALATVSGHATNGAIVRTLMGQGDVVLLDSLAHNSLYEGVRASGASHVSVPHGDTEWLKSWLLRHRDDYQRVLIAVEGLYSMDGDIPDLAALVELKDRYDAWLLVDEAHSIGVLGERGAGIAEFLGIDPSRIDILMGTLSKTLCACGGFVAGSKEMVSIMRYSAPSFVYSVGLSVPNATAAHTSLNILTETPSLVADLKARSSHFHSCLKEEGLDTGHSAGFAIVPVIIGDSARAAWVSNKLLEDGINVLPIMAPAVPNRSARLRFFLNAGHSENTLVDVARLTAKRVMEVKDVRF